MILENEASYVNNTQIGIIYASYLKTIVVAASAAV